MEIIIKEHNCRGGRGELFYYAIFQFGRCAKTGDSVEGGGVPYFIVIYSSLEDVKKRGSGRGGGVPSFIVIYSSLEAVYFMHFL